MEVAAAVRGFAVRSVVPQSGRGSGLGGGWPPAPTQRWGLCGVCVQESGERDQGAGRGLGGFRALALLECFFPTKFRVCTRCEEDMFFLFLVSPRPHSPFFQDPELGQLTDYTKT